MRNSKTRNKHSLGIWSYAAVRSIKTNTSRPACFWITFFTMKIASLVERSFLKPNCASEIFSSMFYAIGLKLYGEQSCSNLVQLIQQKLNQLLYLIENLGPFSRIFLRSFVLYSLNPLLQYVYCVYQ